jgi:iron complex outermembrane receptor protein
VESSPDYQPVGLPLISTHTAATVLDAESTYSSDFDLLVPHELHLGGGYRLKHIDWDWLGPPRNEHHGKAFAEDRMQLTGALATTFGLRLDRHPVVGTTPSARGAVVYRLDENSSVRLTAGTAFRNPTFVENYLSITLPTPVAAVGARSLGEIDLLPEEIVQIDLGVILGDGDFVTLEAVGYVQEVRNLITLDKLRGVGSPGVPLDGSRRPDPESGTFIAGETSFTNDREVSQGGGMELGLHLIPARGVDLKLSYTFELMRGEGGDRRLENPLHKGHVGVQFRTDQGIDLGFDGYYVSAINIPERDFDPVTRELVVQDCRVDSYTIANARVGYRMWDDSLELSVAGSQIGGALGGRQTHREHCYGNTIGPRVYGSLTYRFGR